MCGIFGIVRPSGTVHQDTVKNCLHLVRHRGPDGAGTWFRPSGRTPSVAFGHRRLAIIDLTDAAAQPMPSDDGSLWITYNGEIYNYLELVPELESHGHRFRSHSDTEVLLRAYQQWGVDCLQRLNGMFAFAIWDETRRELFAARDRFGEKPFYYVWHPATGDFAFASEVKALAALPGVDCALDDRALYRYVAFQELAGNEQTLWRDIRRLPHAHWLRIRYGVDGGARFEMRRYWDIDLERQDPVAPAEAARRFAELFEDSVRLRLRADVTVGTSLSGGLDSSAVVCQIHALGAASGQKTFSARMDDPALDEGRFIAPVLAQTGVEGREVWPSPDELQALFANVCYHLEEPFAQTSQFAQHLVMRLARDHDVTVLLDGQGADELFAGYVPYFVARYSQLAEDWRLFTLLREWRGFRRRHERRFPLGLRSIVAYAVPGFAQRFRSADGATLDTQPILWREMASWWDREWLDAYRTEAPPELRSSRRDRLTRRLYQDAMQGELQELLRFGDRNSMAWSREVRQPFLDHRLAEFAFALPPELKLDRGETKVVMRGGVKGLVPDLIVNRQDKLGYQAPLPAWLKGPLAGWTERNLEQCANTLGDRMKPDAPGRFRSMAATLDESAGRAVFGLMTVGETTAAMASTAHAREAGAPACRE